MRRATAEELESATSPFCQKLIRVCYYHYYLLAFILRPTSHCICNTHLYIYTHNTVTDYSKKFSLNRDVFLNNVNVLSFLISMSEVSILVIILFVVVESPLSDSKAGLRKFLQGKHRRHGPAPG